MPLGILSAVPKSFWFQRVIGDCRRSQRIGNGICYKRDIGFDIGSSPKGGCDMDGWQAGWARDGTGLESHY